MKTIVKEMYELLVRLHQSPFVRDPERAEIEEVLDRATKDLMEPEVVEGTDGQEKLICHLMDLNVKADQPTKNGNVYPRKVLESAIQGKSPMVFVRPVMCLPPKMEDMVGVVEQMRINDDGELLGTGFLVKTPRTSDLMFVKGMLEQGKLSFSIGGVGKIEDDGVVSEFDMTHVVLEREPSESEPPPPPEPPEPVYWKE